MRVNTKIMENNKNNEIKIAHIEHQNEVIIKDLAEIKLILINQSRHEQYISNRLSPGDLIGIQEIEAEKYINNIVIPKGEANQNNLVGVQSFWQEAVLSVLKTQALVYVGKSLELLKKQAIGWAVDFSYWLLTNLEDYLVSCYKRSSEEEQEIFFAKIKEYFPESNLIKKLS